MSTLEVHHSHRYNIFQHHKVCQSTRLQEARRSRIHVDIIMVLITWRDNIATILSLQSIWFSNFPIKECLNISSRIINPYSFLLIVSYWKPKPSHQVYHINPKSSLQFSSPITTALEWRQGCNIVLVRSLLKHSFHYPVRVELIGFRIWK